jgi:cytochrome c oxidase cbb3-type subunit 2
MFHWLEQRPFFFVLGVFLVMSFAGVIQNIPDFNKKSQPLVGTKPYTVLELAGRQVYVANNCLSCHSQMIRPFKSETDRYGMYSLSGEYVYDRPFLWGSRRIGPDLMRIGNYRTTDWHENHMMDPASVVPGTLMPAYSHMFTKNADIATAYANANTQKQVFGVPYDQANQPKLGSWADAQDIALAQAKVVVADMKNQSVKDAVAGGEIPEIVAIIAYMNSLK